jgi:hypothetical protein
MAMASAIRRVIPKPDHDQTEILSICAVLCCLFEWVVSKGQRPSATVSSPNGLEFGVGVAAANPQSQAHWQRQDDSNVGSLREVRSEESQVVLRNKDKGLTEDTSSFPHFTSRVFCQTLINEDRGPKNLEF